MAKATSCPTSGDTSDPLAGASAAVLTKAIPAIPIQVAMSTSSSCGPAYRPSGVGLRTAMEVPLAIPTCAIVWTGHATLPAAAMAILWFKVTAAATPSGRPSASLALVVPEVVKEACGLEAVLRHGACAIATAT